ncbi:MAG TPA: Ig-like domain repeat protein [Candidatus Acidoferrum sp.]|nr:Ig-like domain repeat protein [Candidatus Acidoferrum sp.]
MKPSSRILLILSLCAAIGFLFSGIARHVFAQSASQSVSAFSQRPYVPSRITQAIDDTQLVRLKGNVHPLARPEFDQGAVPDSTPMQRMIMVLQRSPEQEAALAQFMEQQQSKDSPNFHKWLTPQQFGQQFGPSDGDIQTITDWLTQQGFQQIKVGNGRTAIEFSGNVGQVRSAFHTDIHQFKVNGAMRQANVSDPQIPAALAPVVQGILSLHNFPRKSYFHSAGVHTSTRDIHGQPQFTTSNGCGSSQTLPCYVLGPADFAIVYNIPASLDGTGESIAIVGDSNINPQDVTDFRTLFGLPNNPPNIILNGPDPGINGDEGEADLDVEVSGMVAPKATIDFVVSESTLTANGIDLSALYIVDNNIAPVMSESFGACENALGSSNAFYNSLWEQAAAQGITVTISSGDPGAAGCDNFNKASAASNGLAVSGFASTPFNVAVGGTDFDDAGTQTNFWNPSTNNAAGTRASALGYIHEIPWNDSCAANATSANLNTICSSPNNIVGGGGGVSSVYTKPAWQSGINPNGVASGTNSRFVPDVSLFASDGPKSQSFYLVCEADALHSGSKPSCASSGSFSFLGAGGTSASSPAFAAIMALINQNNGRQGNPNPTLYKIAATAGQSCNSSTETLTGNTCAFNDVTKGNNSVPCTANSLNCSSKTTGATGVLVSPASATTPAWTTATGYDLATGLGSVNVANLNTQWPVAVGKFTGTTTSLKLNGGTTQVTITHGQSVTAAITVSPTSGTGTPTGDVALVAPTSVNGGIGSNTLSGGTVSFPTTFLPGGTNYNVTARYAGDDTFSSSMSNSVPVMVNKENSRLQYSIVTFDPVTGNPNNTNATSLVYGSPYILRIDILNSSTNACQPLVTGGVTTGCAVDATGTVTITDNGSPLDTGTFVINSEGHAEDQPIQLSGGVNSLSATYSGDISYNPVTTPVLDAITVSKAATQGALGATPLTGVTTATPVTLTATFTAPTSNGAGPTGTVTFTSNGTAISGTPTITSVPFNVSTGAPPTMTATLATIFTTAGTDNIVATYAGDGNYTGSTGSTSVTVTQAIIGSFTVAESAVTLNSATGASVNSTVTVTPSGGFTGTVAVTPTAGSVPGVTCTPSPLNINVTTAAAATGQLACTVTATSTTLTASNFVRGDLLEAKAASPMGAKGWWALSAGTGLAALFLIFIPGGKKKLHAALGLTIVCLICLSFGCSGGYGGGGGGGGPVATTTSMTASADKVLSGTAFTFNVTVSGGTPAGMAQLFDGGTAISTAGASAAVSGGKATLTAPTTLAVGTHAISVHYLGDQYTAASQSGSLNLTVTGSTTLAITTNPAATPAAPALSVTIQ